jgi:hypothetical protein
MSYRRDNSEPGINTNSAFEKQSHHCHCGNSTFDHEIDRTLPAKKRICVWQFDPHICKLVQIQDLEATINSDHHPQLSRPVTRCFVLDWLSFKKRRNEAESFIVSQLLIPRDPVPCLEAGWQNAVPMLGIG